MGQPVPAYPLRGVESRPNRVTGMANLESEYPATMQRNALPLAAIKTARLDQLTH
jgi:hypothetical protein